MVGGFLGSVLTGLLQITMDDFDNLWKLVLITTLCIPLPLILVNRVPATI